MIPETGNKYLTEYAGPVLEIEMENDDVVVPVLLDEMPVITEEDESAETEEDLPPSYETTISSFEKEGNSPTVDVFQHQNISTHALCDTTYATYNSAWAPMAHVGQAH